MVRSSWWNNLRIGLFKFFTVNSCVCHLKLLLVRNSCSFNKIGETKRKSIKDDLKVLHRDGDLIVWDAFSISVKLTLLVEQLGWTILNNMVIWLISYYWTTDANFCNFTTKCIKTVVQRLLKGPEVKLLKKGSWLEGAKWALASPQKNLAPDIFGHDRSTLRCSLFYFFSLSFSVLF